MGRHQGDPGWPGPDDPERYVETVMAPRRRSSTSSAVAARPVLPPSQSVIGGSRLRLKSANSTLAAHPDGRPAYTEISTASVEANRVHPHAEKAFADLGGSPITDQVARRRSLHYAQAA